MIPYPYKILIDKLDYSYKKKEAYVFRIFAVLIIGFAVTACQGVQHNTARETDYDFYDDNHVKTHSVATTVGVVGGAVIGCAIHPLGGKVASTIFGAVLGGALGNNLEHVVNYDAKEFSNKIKDKKYSSNAVSSYSKTPEITMESSLVQSSSFISPASKYSFYEPPSAHCCR